MRLLIISHSYSPALSPRAFRWAALAEHWAAAGDHVDVISGRPIDGSAYELLKGVHAHRPSAALIEFAGAAVTSSTSGAQESKHRSGTPEAVARIRAAVVGAARGVWRRTYWPDYACLWYRPATSCARRLLSNATYDGVITVSLPYTAHLVGMALHQHGLVPMGSRWIADIGDPFAFMDDTPTNNHSLYRRVNYRSEAKLVTSASSIAVTTAATRDKYVEVFGDIADKLRVIPPMVTIEAPASATAPDLGAMGFALPGKIRLAYFGTLYRNIREPRYLLQLFSALLETRVRDRLELHFFGNSHDCEEQLTEYRSSLGGKLVLHGVVDRPTVAAAMSRANVLVNIGNKTSYQLPSKVVEAASLGKPILNLVNSPEDSSRTLLATYPAALSMVEQAVVDPDDLARLVAFIENPPHVEESVLQRWCEPFNIGPIASAYESLLAS